MKRPLIGIPAHTQTVDGAEFFSIRSTYARAIEAHGGVPVMLAPLGSAIADRYLDTVDGLLIPGGTDIDPAAYGETPHAKVLSLDPELDVTELALIREAYERDLPTLAVCRGIQSVAVAFGGNLIQDLPSQLDGLRHEVRENGRQFLAHEIRLELASRFREILGRDRVGVNSFHHQAVRTLPDALSPVAWSDDGILEAAEAASKRFMIAVQCHPEELWDSTAPEFSRLFAAFVDACRS